MSSTLAPEEQQCLDAFREWILSNRTIVNPITEDAFLLRFLYQRKFNLEKACESYVLYVKTRNDHPLVYKNLDIDDPLVLDLLSRGYFIPLREEGPEGRTVVLFTGREFKKSQGHRGTDMFRALMMSYEVLSMDIEFGRNGFIMVDIQEGIDFRDVVHCGIAFAYKAIKSMSGALPLRPQEYHWVKMPAVLTFYAKVCMTFAPKKLKERLFVHKNFDDLREALPSLILPQEYGGTVLAKDMAALWVQKIRRNRDKLLAMDEMYYDENRS